MKRFLAFVAVVMAVQISLAGYVRVKRNDFAANDPLVYYKTTKALVQRFEPLIKSVIADLPATEAYGKHKQALENYLLKAEDTKAKKEICFIKVFQMLEDFIDVLTPYKEEDNKDSAEGQKVLELFNSHGYTQLEKEFQEFVVGYDVEKFGKRVDNLNPSDDYELLEQC